MCIVHKQSTRDCTLVPSGPRHRVAQRGCETVELRECCLQRERALKGSHDSTPMRMKCGNISRFLFSKKSQKSWCLGGIFKCWQRIPIFLKNLFTREIVWLLKSAYMISIFNLHNRLGLGPSSHRAPQSGAPWVGSPSDLFPMTSWRVCHSSFCMERDLTRRLLTHNASYRPPTTVNTHWELTNYTVIRFLWVCSKLPQI